VRYFVHTPDGHLLYTVEASTGERHFYHFDEAGNSIALTDMQGSVAAAYAYTPFGEVLSSSGSVENAFTFGGRYGVQAEGRTGLYYMRARFYDAATARFVSRDPLQSFSPELLNPYQYALGNPLMVGDPTGLKPFDLPPSPQAPSPLRPQSEFSSREDFLKHYDEWSDQMDRWLKEVQERDRLIDELRKRHQEEFLKKWREGWEEYGRAVAESNAIILRQELLARGHSVTLQTVRLLQQDEGITSVEEFEDYLARGRAAAMAVHNQAMAAVGFAVQAHLASRREAAKPCPVPVSSGGLLNDSWVPGPEDVRLLRQERDEIKAGLGAIYRFFDFQWLR
jgi:RHS repeat-associated protein